MATIKFPQTVRKEGTTLTVTIYRRRVFKETSDGTKKYVEYSLAYYQDGARKIKTSSDYDSLRAAADEVLDDLHEGRTEPHALSISERNELTRALKLIEPTKLSLDVVAKHFARAFEILGGDHIIEAAQAYVSRGLNKIQPTLVSEVVTEFITEKEQQKKSQAHTARLRTHLGRFGESMVKNITTVTAAEIDAFTDSLRDEGKKVSTRTHDNYAHSIVTLMRWAKKKRYLPSDFDEHERITYIDTDNDGEIEIYTPAELEALLAKAKPELIPFLAIGAFAGLRSSEIMKLDWADVRLENGDPHIVVQQGKVKKRGKSRRIVPMTDNLKAWLKPHARTKGSVWPHSVPYLYEMLRELAPKAEARLKESDAEAKLPLRSNALRHGFISYRVASIKNVAQVALEAGNSPQMIFSNYRELVTEQDAQAWFAILPK